MQVISVDDLVNYKTLPFDIFNEKGKKLFSAGEILTPGKILQLKYIPLLYINESKEKLEIIDEETDYFNNIDLNQNDPDDIINIYKALDIKNQYENENSILPVTTQKTIKNKFKEIIDSFSEKNIKDASACFDVRDRIIEEILPEVENIAYKSQLQLFGDYNYSHGINVAMLSAVLADKLKLSQSTIQDVTLGAMLHDIGKLRLPKQIIEKTSHSQAETKLLHLHPRIGHKIILEELKLPENIANIALQHHEKSDGSGYPYGLSGDRISYESQIVMVCNMYDDLTSGRSQIKVRNSKEAIKVLLEIGSKWFRADVLYTFVHMTNYNDNSTLYNY